MESSWDLQKMLESAEMLNQSYQDVAMMVERLAGSRRLVHPNVDPFHQLSGAKNTACLCCLCYSEFCI